MSFGRTSSGVGIHRSFTDPPSKSSRKKLPPRARPARTPLIAHRSLPVGVSTSIENSFRLNQALPTTHSLSAPSALSLLRRSVHQPTHPPHFRQLSRLSAPSSTDRKAQSISGAGNTQELMRSPPKLILPQISFPLAKLVIFSHPLIFRDFLLILERLHLTPIRCYTRRGRGYRSAIVYGQYV